MAVIKSTEQELRFWRAVKKTEACWLWMGGTSRGYGQILFDGRNQRTHRVSWQLAHGPIPSGLWVLHHCDVRACVNPAHLYLGTPKDNIRDMHARGRCPDISVFLQAAAEWRDKAHGETHPSAKLTNEQVAQIRALIGQRPHRVIAAEFGISVGHVSRIRNRYARAAG